MHQRKMAEPDISSTSSMLGGMTSYGSSKHDVPVEHLEYSYVEKCSNVKELEKILKFLRSGKEGRYPDLERFTEDRIKTLNPSSKALRKDQPITTPADLEKEERDNINADLQNWSSEMKSSEIHIQGDQVQNANLPPVRSSHKTTLSSKESEKSEVQSKPDKRVKPRDYKEWDKFDIEGELSKLEEQEKIETQKKAEAKAAKKPYKLDIDDKIDGSGLSDKEKETLAAREKDKGNEAFRAGDHDEALIYYNRSLSLVPSAASYNNRALTYVRLQMWDLAIQDCNKVLKLEPDNIKAYLRRGVALKGKEDFVRAKRDLQQALSLEPTNKRAKELLQEVTSSIAKEEEEKRERKAKGRRMVIEEVEGSDSEEEMELKMPSSDKEKNQGNKLLIQEVEITNSVKESKNQLNGTSIVNGESHIESTDETICDEDNVVARDTVISSECAQTQAKCSNTSPSTSVSKNVSNGATDNVENSHENEKYDEDNKETDKTDNVEQSDNSTKTDDQSVEITKSDDAAASKSVTSASCVHPEIPPPVLPPPPPLPETVINLKNEGNILFRSGQYAEAICDYSKAIDELIATKLDYSGNLATLYSNRAACRSKIGDCRGCIQDCTASLTLAPHSLKPLLRRAAAYETMEKYKDAYIDYKHVLALDSSPDMAHQGSSRCQQMLQQLYGSKWRDSLPNIPTVTGPPGGATITTVASKPAVTVTTTTNTSPQIVTSAQTTNGSTPSVTGSTVLQEELSAEEKFEKLKAEGNAFVQKGVFGEAVDCYTACIGVCPEKAVSYTNRALCYIRLNKAQLAETDTTEALNLDSNNIKALFRRAQARKMLKHYKESLEDLTKLLKLDPKNSPAKKELELVKNYYREELAAKKADMPSPTKQTTSTCPLKKTEKYDKEKKESNQKPHAESDKIKQQSSAKNQKQKKATRGSDGLPKSVPQTPKLAKATPYEFMQAWNSLKMVKDLKPYAELLQQIQPADLPKVLSNKLDDHMLTTMLKSIDKYLVDTGDIQKAYKYMYHLGKVPRFQMVILFISDKDKSEVKNILEKVKTSNSLSNRDLQSLEMLYRV